MVINLKPTKNTRQIALFCVISLVLITVLIVGSYLLWENLHEKTWEEIKQLIISSLVFYGGMVWLIIKVVVDIILYVKKIKNLKNHVLKVIESPSAYKPKSTFKSSQVNLPDEIFVEFKVKEHSVRVGKKEIVIVYGREFTSSNDYYNELLYIFGEISERVRKTAL